LDMPSLELPPPMLPLDLTPSDAGLSFLFDAEEEQPPRAPKIRPSTPPVELDAVPILQLPPPTGGIFEAPASPVLKLKEAQPGIFEYLSTAGVEFQLVQQEDLPDHTGGQPGTQVIADVHLAPLEDSWLLTPASDMDGGDNPLKGPCPADTSEYEASGKVESALEDLLAKSPVLSASWKTRARTGTFCSSCSTSASTTSLAEHSPRTTIGEASPRMTFCDASPLPSPGPSRFLIEMHTMI